MKTKIPTVSIGIAAHNEAKNIVYLLRTLLKQNQNRWKLEEILVYCDGCTDNTAALARSVGSKYIHVVDDGKRLGKVGRINQINTVAKGSIISIFDADLKIGHANVITDLVHAFENDKIALVGGNTQPVQPASFFQRAVYSTFLVFERSRKYLHNGDNIFGCNGGCIAYRKTFAKLVRIPNVINEDDFLYFSCLKNNLVFKHVPTAVVYYKLPNTLKDYLSQTFRSNPEAVTLNFTKYFGDRVSVEYHRPFMFLVHSIWLSFLTYPVETLYITIINMFTKPLFPLISTRYKLEWYVAMSTK